MAKSVTVVIRFVDRLTPALTSLAPTTTPNDSALANLARKLNAGTPPGELTAEWYAADCPPQHVIDQARAEEGSQP
jgi:hypothetical protein